MSVTFTYDGAPEERIEHECACCHGAGCAYCAMSGVAAYMLPLAGHYLNLANENAAAIMSIVGLGDSLWDGPYEIKHADLPALIQRCVRAINSERGRRAAVRPDRRSGRVFEFGLDDDGVVDRVQRLLEVVKYAQEAGASLRWS